MEGAMPFLVIQRRTVGQTPARGPRSGSKWVPFTYLAILNIRRFYRNPGDNANLGHLRITNAR